MKLRWIMAVVWVLCASGAQAELNWQAALSGEHRSDDNKARDKYRHPQACHRR